MAYIRITLSIKPRTAEMLKAIAKDKDRSRSKTVDLLIQLEYNRVFNKTDKAELIRQKLDELPPKNNIFTDPRELL